MGDRAVEGGISEATRSSGPPRFNVERAAGEQQVSGQRAGSGLAASAGASGDSRGGGDVGGVDGGRGDGDGGDGGSGDGSGGGDASAMPFVVCKVFFFFHNKQIRLRQTCLAVFERERGHGPALDALPGWRASISDNRCLCNSGRSAKTLCLSLSQLHCNSCSYEAKCSSRNSVTFSGFGLV